MSIDYEYYLGRKDIIYAMPDGIERVAGAPSDNPKLPIAPEGTLSLASVDCPPNSTDMSIKNFGLARVTMDQVRKIMEDVESLKYNDALSQMNSALAQRDGAAKKGIYSDDFQSDAQSDAGHPEYSARVDTLQKFVAPGRAASSHVLQVDTAASTVKLTGSLALLPGTERVLIEQLDWSEEKNVNPYAAFDPPPANIAVTPNIGRRGQTGIAITGSSFTPNASNITVKCDGQSVATSVYADSTGRMTSSFVIPEGATNGSRTVEATDGVHSAQASLQINDPLAVTRIERIVEERIVRVQVERIVWRWHPWWGFIDPLAQTFSFGDNRVVSAVGLYFAHKDASIPVRIQIRGVTSGLPNSTVFAEKILSPAEVNVDAETRVAFSDPFCASANTSYALVIMTDSTNYRVRMATLGQPGQNGIITRQAYAAGVLLESSNAETWTPLNGSDLSMRVYGYDFAQAGELRFQGITGIQVSDLNIDEYSSVPLGTSITWEYSVDDGFTWDAIVPEEEERLPNVESQVLVRAKFASSTANDTPALNYKDVNLLGYLNNGMGTYVTRECALLQGVSSTKVYAEMNIPSGTTVNWHASNDGGMTWEAMTLDSTRPIDGTWTEYALSRTFADSAGNRVRYKAVMTGSSLIYPRIHTLGATLS